jgi:hypothetical protein
MNFMRSMRESSEADAVLAVFAPEYFQSHYCKEELDGALTGTETRLLPVRVMPCDPGTFLRNRIYIDLVNKSGQEARESLVSGVAAFVALTRNRGHSHGFRARPDFPGAEGRESGPISPAIAPSRGRLKVLFVGPAVGGLSPRKQFVAVKSAVAGVRGSGRVVFKGVFRVHLETLFEELNHESPDVFHLSGKQNGGDILIPTGDGEVSTISDRELAGMFQSLDEGLKLVAIDTCFSLRCATSISKVVPCAIGVEGDVYEDDATLYYKTFYRAVAAGRSVRDAAAQSSSALKFVKVPKEQIPQLCCRSDIDPAKVHLVAPQCFGRGTGVGESACSGGGKLRAQSALSP